MKPSTTIPLKVLEVVAIQQIKVEQFLPHMHTEVS